MRILYFRPKPPGTLAVYDLHRLFLGIITLATLASSCVLNAADFTVTSPGFFYSFNGGSTANPTITLQRGKTYTFAVNADSFHPLFIESTGVQNNNASQGTITWKVPNVVSNYAYICSVHHFGGTILTVAAPPPPAPKIKILSVLVSSNLTLFSTGTNNWSVKPEYSTNLATTNWFALTVVTNRFIGGTNETICGLPPVSPALLRIRSQPN
jgi:hypothetical protein